MQVIIAGAGEVGGHAAEVLSDAGHNVTILDLDAARLQSLNDTLDVRTLTGHCAHFDVLLEAGAERCDLMLAAEGPPPSTSGRLALRRPRRYCRPSSIRKTTLASWLFGLNSISRSIRTSRKPRDL